MIGSKSNKNLKTGCFWRDYAGKLGQLKQFPFFGSLLVGPSILSSYIGAPYCIRRSINTSRSHTRCRLAVVVCTKYSSARTSPVASSFFAPIFLRSSLLFAPSLAYHKVQIQGLSNFPTLHIARCQFLLHSSLRWP